MSSVHVAVVQVAPIACDREGTLERVRLLTSEPTRKGARLIVFPEAFVSGYPRGPDFGARVGLRTPEGREWFRRYQESAIDVPGPGRSRPQTRVRLLHDHGLSEGTGLPIGGRRCHTRSANFSALFWSSVPVHPANDTSGNRSCRPQCQPRARRSARPERAAHRAISR